MTAQKKLAITETGIVGLDIVSEDQFFDYGKQLAQAEHGLQWAIGDWYNNIPKGKGNKYSTPNGKKTACERAGLNYKTANTCGYVAASFTPPARTGELTFKHYKMLVTDNLEFTDRDKLLKLAIEGDTDAKGNQKKWTSAKLKKERDKVLGVAPPPPTEEFNKDMNKLEEAVIKAMPKGTNKRSINTVKSGLKDLAEGLQKEFTEVVNKKVEEKTQKQRENMKATEAKAKAAFDRTIKMQAGVKAFMNRDEFLLIRKCLHPDKNSTPDATEAFKIFNRLADVKNWEK